MKVYIYIYKDSEMTSEYKRLAASGVAPLYLKDPTCIKCNRTIYLGAELQLSVRKKKFIREYVCETNQTQPFQIRSTEADTLPPEFIDPISKSFMVNPVLASDGHLYEFAELVKWFSKNQTSLFSKAPLLQTVYPVFFIQSMISERLAQFGAKLVMPLPPLHVDWQFTAEEVSFHLDGSPKSLRFEKVRAVSQNPCI
jgi:hypothetical protein